MLSTFLFIKYMLYFMAGSLLFIFVIMALIVIKNKNVSNKLFEKMKDIDKED